ncbi:hypothetical protein MELE44368_12355 [Mycolicibacterium elephantis DSM 44368]|uniref:Uncharacterized protein n=1 Tax=Mycolicibacterium elephantis DSM 44368 TaxID=1335622 RepID=A0A439DYD8_9MYCO|nr:hypothetical protein MELE44368_12355 [Mycolicibacterium elephantis DSM 44368]
MAIPKTASLCQYQSSSSPFLSLCILLIAPAGKEHLARIFVTAGEKGADLIGFEFATFASLRLL